MEKETTFIIFEYCSVETYRNQKTLEVLGFSEGGKRALQATLSPDIRSDVSFSEEIIFSKILESAQAGLDIALKNMSVGIFFGPIGCSESLVRALGPKNPRVDVLALRIGENKCNVILVLDQEGKCVAHSYEKFKIIQGVKSPKSFISGLRPKPGSN